MATISLCMIVKNEEDTLERCLDSVNGIFDEIIIVDTGSTDKTKDTARKFTQKIYDFHWIDDFSAARNYSFDKAMMDYLMWLDADDVLLPQDREKFLVFKDKLDPAVDFVMMKYNTGFDTQGNVTFSYYRERISKRSTNCRWVEPVHEYLQLSGNIINADICVTHRKKHAPPTGRNLDIYSKLISAGKQLSPRGLYYYARELKDNGRYDDAIGYYNAFLDSGQGWVEDNICACGDLSICYRLKGDDKNSLKTLLRSFEYDTPRAEICCQIGYHFKNQKRYDKALFWFDTAEKLNKPENSWGFIQNDYWGYIPCIELAVCHDKLGNMKEAVKYNNKAGEYKPNDPSVLYNKKYFEKNQEDKVVTEKR